MSDLVAIIATLFLPLAGVAAILLWIAGTLTGPRNGRVLRWVTLTLAALLGVTYALIILGTETCGGSMLYGYSNCRILPTSIANLSLAAFVLGTFGSALIALLTLAGSLIAEWRHRRQYDNG